MNRRRMWETIALAAMLGLVPRGAVAQCCGDCDGNGQVAVNELVSAVNRALEGCLDDGVCSASTCPGQLAECLGNLADCRAQPGGHASPASGQTTPYGTGSDGDVQAGATLSYTDNGDGTVTDNNTGLMWEKKDDNNTGGIHDKDNTYTWWGSGSGGYLMDGTIKTAFLDVLNDVAGGGVSCFAGHCDWRIPNIKELQDIVNYEIPSPGPTVDAAFHQSVTCTGCTDVTAASCSCTVSDYDWSSTTYRDYPGNAWVVDFGYGAVHAGGKDDHLFARAVRGGL